MRAENVGRTLGRGRLPAEGDRADRPVGIACPPTRMQTVTRAGNAYAAKAASCEDARAARPYSRNNGVH